MNSFDGIVVMAGVGTRLKKLEHKGLIPFNSLPLFLYSINTFLQVESLATLFLVVHLEDEKKVLEIISTNHLDESKIKVVIGGKTRAESVRNALRFVKEDKVVIHDAARPLLNVSDIEEIVEALDDYDALSYYHPIYDTVKMINNGNISTLPRQNLRAVSTPQAFKRNTYKTILNPLVSDDMITDELSLLEETFNIGFILEKHNHLKITTEEDEKTFLEILGITPSLKIGHSFDFHPFGPNRALILGGVMIPYSLGLVGHSDADVVYHVVAESIIGALALGDLGTHFPDSDIQFKDKDSSFFVKYVKEKLNDNQYIVQNMDIIIYLEEPKLYPYKRLMAQNIASLLEIESNAINVKATTMEHRGIIGKGEGIAAEAVVIIQKIKME